jgi:hypothetical protein
MLQRRPVQHMLQGNRGLRKREFSRRARVILGRTKGKLSTANKGRRNGAGLAIRGMGASRMSQKDSDIFC